ncbi:MAG: hypothetical protein AAB225_08075 [Acidobacteriota bacterium]
MAYFTVKRVSELARGHVLAPERYDPRRGSLLLADGDLLSVALSRVAESARMIVGPGTDAITQAIILDTSDAREGLVISAKTPVDRNQIGSAKKCVRVGDVIISRLRPYLRQVAFVDARIPNWRSDVALVCSTEFFVLRSIDERPISFLVPFLLSAQVQAILAAAQEGGHHPRFNEATLFGLPVPKAVLEKREDLSAEVELATALYRDSETKLWSLVLGAEAAIAGLRSVEAKVAKAASHHS